MLHWETRVYPNTFCMHKFHKFLLQVSVTPRLRNRTSTLMKDELFPACIVRRNTLCSIVEPVQKSRSPSGPHGNPYQFFFAVEGVLVGVELRHLCRRQVHRDRIRWQKGHCIRSDLLDAYGKDVSRFPPLGRNLNSLTCSPVRERGPTSETF